MSFVSFMKSEARSSAEIKEDGSEIRGLSRGERTETLCLLWTRASTPILPLPRWLPAPPGASPAPRQLVSIAALL